MILGGSCPAVAYQQGAADYCVAYGAASAVLHAGDHTTAAAIAGVAATALHSGDALGIVRDFLHSVAGASPEVVPEVGGVEPALAVVW